SFPTRRSSDLLFGCDRSENASAFSGFSCQFDRQAFQLFFQLFSFLALKISFLLFFLLLSVQFADGRLVRFNRQIVFQQEVMCVAIRHVFNLAFFAFAFYVFQKDHFHSFVPPSLFSIMAAFSWPMASSIVAFGIWVAALVKWPPPPRFSITIWTFTSPSDLALMPMPPSERSATTKDALTSFIVSRMSAVWAIKTGLYTRPGSPLAIAMPSPTNSTV